MKISRRSFIHQATAAAGGLLAAGFSASSFQEAPLIMTVTGPVSAPELGLTLSHEHLLVDFIGAAQTGYERWDREEVLQRMLPFLLAAKARGVEAFFDCTPAYLGRDPWLLRSLAEASGVRIITNTGLYGARSNQFLPPYAFEETARQLSRRWIREWESGIEGSGVRPGFIKIGVDAGSLSPQHRKLVEAAALTHRATGLTIAAHTGPAEGAFQEMEILRSNGVRPDALIWVHAQAEEQLDFHVRAAALGAWVSLDNVSAGETDRYLQRLRRLKEEKLLHRVLLSHDAGWYSPGEPQGGEVRGFTDLFDHLLPALRQEGFTEEDLRQLLVTNPREALAVRNRLF